MQPHYYLHFNPLTPIQMIVVAADKHFGVNFIKVFFIRRSLSLLKKVKSVVRIFQLTI